MTDEQIMKGLECCGRESCNGCPYRTDRICHQGNPMIRDALELIKHQQAEIKLLKTDPNRRVGESAIWQVIEASQRAEQKIAAWKAEIKAEAIKDFAERLVHTLVINNEENTEFFDFSYTLETIDNLAKEMIGGKNESIQQEDC